jgi:hypothetical protein
MASIDEALRELKRDPLQALPAAWVYTICRDLKHVWRERELPPPKTVGLFIQQVLQANTSCQAVRHLGQVAVSASAWCQARARLPLELYRRVLGKLYQTARARDHSPEYRWHGHRTFLLDGTGVTLWDTPELREHFGLPNGVVPGCGFPVAHLLVLFNAHNGLLADLRPGPAHRSDLADVPAVLAQVGPGDILLGDEAFGCYVVLALLAHQKAQGLFPVHHARTVDFTPHRGFVREGQADAPAGQPHSRWVARLGHQDQLVEYFKPRQKPPWIDSALWEQLPATLRVRELRRTVRGPHGTRRELTMVTTLLDPKAYPARDITTLRGTRWEVETDIRHLKTTLKMDMLHCRSPEGVAKELCVFAMVYNLVRALILAAARRQKQRPQRLSFADALHYCQFARPGQSLPRLHVNPLRPGRQEPRVQKRRDKEFPYMTQPRTQYKRNQ